MRLRDRVRAVRDLIRHQLLEQSHEQSDPVRLPCEHELALEYSTSRNVVRHALAALQQEGFVRRTQGSGTAVRKPKIRVDQTRLRGLALGLAKNGDLIYYEPQLIEYRPAPAPIADALGLVVGAQVAVIERRAAYGGVPLSLNSRYLPMSIGKRILDEQPTNDWFGALEHAAGVPLAGARTIIEAALADEWLAPDLGLPVGSAVILMHRTILDINDQVVEFDLTRSRGDLLDMEYWTPR